MSHYKPYPAYKDSGVKWLGRVPEHWEIVPLKYEAEFVNGAAFKPEQWSEIGTPIIRIENLNGSLNFNCFDGEMDARYHVEQGDLLFGWSGNRGTSFGPFIWPHAGRHYLNQHIFRICNFKFDKAWFYWSLKAVTAHVEDQAHGIIGMVHITKGDLGAIKIATPALAEQQAISAHLDRETARIDALIEKKTRFIELLREKRLALITHAVTKGLDPSAKMKDSGVEWLGEVPEHWRVMAIKHIVATPITDGPHETPEFLDEGVPFVSAEAVSSGRVDFAKIRGFISRNDHERYSQKYCPQRGDIFMIKSGATTGVTAIVETDDEFNIWSPLAVIRCGEIADPYFVLNFMRSRSFQEAVALSWSYGTQQNIGMGVIGNLALTVPPLEEQKRIALTVQAQSVRLDDLIDKTECSIALLKERRAALITAAVTGQIDLREAV